MMQSKISAALAATMTSAAALATYDQAVATGDGADWQAVAHNLASALRKPKATKAKAGGFAADFAKALASVMTVIERGVTIPILSNVRLRASGGAVWLSGTDLDKEVRCVVGGFQGPDFDVTVPAHQLQALLKGARDLEFTFGEDPRFTVLVNGVAAQLPILPSEDFPVMAFKKEGTQRIAGEALAEALKFAMISVSNEETRYYLNGVYLHSAIIEGVPYLCVVSTDGARLHRQMIQVLWTLPAMLVPRKFVAALLKEGLSGEVTIEAGRSGGDGEAVKPRIRVVTSEGAIFTSKLIDGNYPDYQRVIPRGDDMSGALEVLDLNAFTEATKRLASMSNEKRRTIRLELGDEVSGRVRNMESGQATAILPAKYEGEAREVLLNVDYLLASLTAPAILKIGRPDDPVRLDYLGRDDRLAIVMPLRV